MTSFEKMSSLSQFTKQSLKTKRMQLHEAIALIQHPKLASKSPMKWADLGCGSGLFTHALASFLSEGSTIYAVDSDSSALSRVASLPGINLEIVHQDFVRSDWPFGDMDGIFMANSLHYVSDQPAFLEKAKARLTESGSFLLVEYDTDVPNPWVPYPISYSSLRLLFTKAGYTSIEKLHEMPSRYGKVNLYSSYIS